MVRVFSALGCYHVLLVVHGLSGHDFAVLEDNRRVSEDEVNGADYETVPVELSQGVSVECVLKGVDFAPVYDGLVCPDPESHSLVLLWTGSVLEPNVLGYESITNSSCIGPEKKKPNL